MLDCPACHRKSPGRRRCAHCGFEPESIDGIPLWAPEIVPVGVNYDAQHFARLAAVEAGHFWFRARNRLIVWALRRHFPEATTFFEVGCGTGFVLTGVGAAQPSIRLTGAEALRDGLVFARRRLPQAEFMQMDARRIPYVDEFDVVSAFDVLEHIEEDEAVLRELFRATRPGGGILLTVPQHRWLWSAVDVAADHVRRYEPAELPRKVQAAGFEIIRTTSFVCLPLPAMMAARCRPSASRASGAEAELELGRVVNLVLECTLELERGLIRLGANLPVGGSRLVIARKPLH